MNGLDSCRPPFYKQVAPDDAFTAAAERNQHTYISRRMIKALQSELTINIVASIIVSLLFLGIGFLWGKYKERRRKFGRNLEE
jgi:hypothetical protein